MTEKSKRTEQTGASKALKWIAIVSAAAIGLIVEYSLPGWGRPVVLTLGIFGSLVIFCRSVWGIAFWTVAIGTFALHVALMAKFRVTINELTFPALFLWAVVEILAIAIILGLAFPDKKDSLL